MTLRACYDIKEGEEITINYRAGKRLFSMRKRETRQKLLLQAMDFNCSCHFCEKQCDPTRESNMAEKNYIVIIRMHGVPSTVLTFNISNMGSSMYDIRFFGRQVGLRKSDTTT